MNFKNLFATLLCLTAVYAEDNNYKGKCKDLEEKILKYSTEEDSISFNNCNLDNKGNAVDYEIELNCYRKDFNLTQTLIDEISTFTNLKKLSVDGCEPSDTAINFESLKKLEKLTELNLSLTHFFDIIDNIKNLKKLQFSFYAPNTLSSSTIEELEFIDSEFAAIGAKVNLEGLTNIKKLKFTKYNFAYNDVGELNIRLPKNLDYLYLESINPTNDIIKQIVANENLKYLYFHFIEFNSEKYDLTPLTKLTNLIELEFVSNWSGQRYHNSK